jgi:sec-independent protein translocase protein TatC
VSTFEGIVEGFRSRSGDVSFLDRLDDLRGRLITSLVVVTVFSGIGFYLSTRYDVLGIFTAPVQPLLGEEKLKYLNPTTPFFITIQLALSVGVAAALPYLFYQLWALVSPLMLPDEKRLVRPAIIGGFFLFAAGVVFCYYLALPLALRFTMGYQAETLEQSIVIEEYLRLTLRMLVAFGLAFELPIVILLLTVLGAVTPEFLAEKRRHAIAAIVIICAIVTPPDVGSLVLMMLPVMFLYEASIVVSRLIVARRARWLAELEG